MIRTDRKRKECERAVMAEDRNKDGVSKCRKD